MEFFGAAAPALLVLGAALLFMGRFDPEHRAARRAAALAVALLMARYMWWRITESMPEPGWTVDAVAAYAFLALEMLSPAPGIILLHALSKTTRRSEEADANPPERWPGGAPLVDVFVPTYNETAAVLERTIVGALSMGYPRYRVWVLDDQRRPWLRDLAARLGANYLTRPDNSHAKAGNMNNGLAHVMALDEPPAFVAIFDADFIAAPEFLRRTVALMHDPSVGVVQTPQHFFNPDPVQLNLRAPKVVPDEQRFFFDVILASKDAHGTAFSCGTSSVCRVEALKAIGGFPTESVTEDMLLSIKLTAVGYRTVYLNERLSVGLAPEGMHEYITQRSRWCLGTMQIVRTAWGPFAGGGGVPLLMRLHVLDSVLYWSVGTLIRFATILIPILYWWFGVVVMQTDMAGIVNHLGPFWVASVLFIAWISRGTTVPVLTEAMGLVVAVEVAKASAVGLFGSRDQKFKVTAKGGNRGEVVVQWGTVRWLLLAMALTVGGIAFRAFTGPVAGTPAGIETVNLFWSLFNVAALFTACLICVEQPRYRREERFAAAERVEVSGEDGIVVPGLLRDVSLSGARIALPVTGCAPPGARVEVRMAGVRPLAGRVVRYTDGGAAHCCVDFDPDPHAKVELVRKLFSGRYVEAVQSMGAGSFAAALLRRAFR